jgi:hypothetical protein
MYHLDELLSIYSSSNYIIKCPLERGNIMPPSKSLKKGKHARFKDGIDELLLLLLLTMMMTTIIIAATTVKIVLMMPMRRVGMMMPTIIPSPLQLPHLRLGRKDVHHHPLPRVHP